MSRKFFSKLKICFVITLLTVSIVSLHHIDIPHTCRKRSETGSELSQNFEFQIALRSVTTLASQFPSISAHNGDLS